MDAALREKLIVFSTDDPDAPLPGVEVDPLDEAREAGFQEGMEAGRAAAEQEAAERDAAAEAAVLQMADQLNDVIRQIEESHARAISKVLHAVLPEIVDATALQQVQEIISAVSTNALNDKVLIKTSVAFAKELAPVLTKSANATRFTVEPDATINGYVVELSWKDGGGKIDLEAVVKDCLAVFGSAPDDEQGVADDE
jgi:hypothetical protein